MIYGFLEIILKYKCKKCKILIYKYDFKKREFLFFKRKKKLALKGWLIFQYHAFEKYTLDFKSIKWFLPFATEYISYNSLYCYYSLELWERAFWS
jgi:hypothetical protein